MKTLVKIHANSVKSTYGYIVDTYTNKSGTMALIKVWNRADWLSCLCEPHCILLGEDHYEIISK